MYQTKISKILRLHYTQPAVCIFYLACILYPVRSLQSTFCTDWIGIAAFLFERASSPDRNNGARMKILDYLGRYD